jgi:hypothetical protein
MSEKWDEGNEEFPGTETEDANNPMSKLRKAYDRQKKQNEDMQAKLAAFEAGARERALAETLTSRGLNPKLAKFYEGEADQEKIDAWLKDNADVFGLSSAEAQQEPAISPELQSAYEQFQTPTSNKANQSLIDQVANFQMNTNEDYDKFMSFMRSNPGAISNPGGGF